jgi:hypothetical protein
VSTAFDFRLQSNLIVAGSVYHDHGIAGIAQLADANACTDVCHDIYQTLNGDLRGTSLPGIDIGLSGWLLTAFGGRLGAAPKRAAVAAGPDVVATSDVVAGRMSWPSRGAAILIFASVTVGFELDSWI